MPHPYAYCRKCFGEHFIGDKKITTFNKCQFFGQFDGVRSYDQPRHLAFCRKCFKCHKTHNSNSTFDKCTGCGQFDGLRWKKCDVPVFSATSKKCSAFYQSH